MNENIKLIDEGMQKLITQINECDDFETGEGLCKQLRDLAETRQKLVEADANAEKAKAEAKAADKNSRRRLSPDAVLSVVGSIASVLIVCDYEELHCLTSKAISFIQKPKL